MGEERAHLRKMTRERIREALAEDGVAARLESPAEKFPETAGVSP